MYGRYYRHVSARLKFAGGLPAWPSNDITETNQSTGDVDDAGTNEGARLL